MNRKTKWLLAGWFLALGFCTQAKDIEFGGYTWAVRSGRGGPGPNVWDENNAWLDASTNLHLKISQRDGKWSCAEVTMRRRLGFGRYQFQATGRLDRFDDNVVLGLFNYLTGDVGPDGTHEIDIEFAWWGTRSQIDQAIAELSKLGYVRTAPPAETSFETLASCPA
jgi:hypothetical protein